MKIFKFSQINIEEVKILLKVLTRKKAARKDTIKTILLTENEDFFAKYTFDDINHSIRLSKFSKELKQAEIIPPHKTNSKFSEESYRPMSIFAKPSKIHERCLYNQVSTYFKHVFSRYQSSFRKGYSVQYCLLAIIERWKKFTEFEYFSNTIGCIH